VTEEVALEFVTQRRRTGSAASRPCFSFKCQMDRADPIASSDGRLIERRRFEWVSDEWSLAETTRYLNDGLQCVAEFNASNALLRRQVWGLDLDGSRGGLGGIGGLLWIVSVANGTHYAAPDGSGNVVALFGTSGTETARYEYGPFGELLRMSGTAIAAENTWRFSSKRQDPTTDWVHYEFRVYDPSSGRRGAMGSDLSI
jgi:hypothetical protein